MTVRVTTLTGSAAGIGGYYGEQLAGYYGAGGPGAFWHGAGSDVLGLSGVPSAEQLTALMEGVDPGTGDRLGRAFRTTDDAAQDGRPSARGFDVTFSAPKDVSVLWALGDEATATAVLEAMNAAAVAVLDRLDADAPIRARGEIVSGAGLAMAVIPEHTSRAGDPNLHVHAVISSKVRHRMTGRWYALDARELKQHQQALSGLFHRGLEAELSRRLGVEWGTRTQAFAAPLVGSDEAVCDALSSRTKAVDELTEHKLARFVSEMGRAPSPQERWRLGREAAAESRTSKTDVDETAERARWADVATQIRGTNATPYADLLPTGTPQVLTDDILAAAVSAAVATLSETRSWWRRGHVVTEIARHLPSGLDVEAGALVDAVNNAADELLIAESIVQLTNGADPVIDTFTTTKILEEETRIVALVDAGLAEDAQPAVIVDEGLSDAQRLAAGRAAGTGRFEFVIGPAGAGKTTALRAAVASLNTQRRAVFGLAPSAAAAGVLGAEAGVAADNLAKFLFEHTARNGGPGAAYQLPAGATLLVDEAGMVSTSNWSKLVRLAAQKHWRIVAIGDGQQFSAVGRGGMFDLLASTAPKDHVTLLDKVHRFTNDWEATASLALRAGDTTVVDTYLDHGRITAAVTTAEAVTVAADTWAEHAERTTSFGLYAPTRDTVAAINTEIQTRRIGAGAVTELRHYGARRFGVGDHVATRANNRDMQTSRGHWVRNRDTWTIDNINTHTGDLTLTGTSGTVIVDAAYAADSVELAYAQTSHASQGATVDHSLLVVGHTDIVDRAGVYVPMTRGRETNRTIIAGALDITEAADRFATALTNRWIDTPALTQTEPAQPTNTPADNRPEATIIMTNNNTAGDVAAFYNEIAEQHKPLLEHHRDLVQECANNLKAHQQTRRSGADWDDRASDLQAELDEAQHTLTIAEQRASQALTQTPPADVVASAPLPATVVEQLAGLVDVAPDPLEVTEAVVARGQAVLTRAQAIQHVKRLENELTQTASRYDTLIAQHTATLIRLGNELAALQANGPALLRRRSWENQTGLLETAITDTRKTLTRARAQQTRDTAPIETRLAQARTKARTAIDHADQAETRLNQLEPPSQRHARRRVRRPGPTLSH